MGALGAGDRIFPGRGAGSGNGTDVTTEAFTPTVSASTNVTIAEVMEGYATKVGQQVNLDGAIRMSVTGAGLVSVTFDLPYPPDDNYIISGYGSSLGAIGGPYILTVAPDGAGSVKIIFTATSAEATAYTPFTISYKAAA